MRGEFHGAAGGVQLDLQEATGGAVALDGACGGSAGGGAAVSGIHGGAGDRELPEDAANQSSHFGIDAVHDSVSQLARHLELRSDEADGRRGTDGSFVSAGAL